MNEQAGLVHEKVEKEQKKYLWIRGLDWVEPERATVVQEHGRVALEQLLD